jgi:hypothetical protein
MAREVVCLLMPVDARHGTGSGEDCVGEFSFPQTLEGTPGKDAYDPLLGRLRVPGYSRGLRRGGQESCRALRQRLICRGHLLLWQLTPDFNQPIATRP